MRVDKLCDGWRLGYEGGEFVMVAIYGESLFMGVRERKSESGDLNLTP